MYATTSEPIELTPPEQALVDRLKRAAEPHDIIVRFAGGWVFDKLLGLSSPDIDVALEGCTGAYFVEKVLGLFAHVVEAKPDQSKHLETACVRVEGFSIDFSNLRDESGGGAYSDPTNRIPQQNILATPDVDASRRDFKIKALFYNIHTGCIEDYVGALADMGFENGEPPEKPKRLLLDTPLDPVTTFSDDPVRVLRGLRAMCRYWQYDAYLSDRVLDAMSHPEVKKRFRERLSPERIAIELFGKTDDTGFKRGILAYQHGWVAIEMLAECGLLNVILDVPAIQDFHPFDVEQKTKHHAYNVFEHTINTMLSLSLSVHWGMDMSDRPDRQAWAMFGCLLHDIGKRDRKVRQQKTDGDYSYHGHEDVSAEVARAICNKLKLSEEATNYVVQVCRYHMEPHGKDWGKRDSTLRRFMRKLPDTWEIIITHAESDMTGTGVPHSPEEYQAYREHISRCKYLLQHDPVKATEKKPPVPGDKIMALYPELKQGPWIKVIMNRLQEIRDERPDAPEEELLSTATGYRDEILSDNQYMRFRLK